MHPKRCDTSVADAHAALEPQLGVVVGRADEVLAPVQRHPHARVAFQLAQRSEGGFVKWPAEHVFDPVGKRVSKIRPKNSIVQVSEGLMPTQVRLRLIEPHLDLH